MNRLCEFCRVNLAIHCGRARLLLLLLLAAAGFSAFAQSDEPTDAATTSSSNAGGLDESSFRIISERNIFNANRIGPMRINTNRRREAVVESFTLVGTMTYEKGSFAFFSGSRSDFTRAVKDQGVIAGFKVASIESDRVKLEADGKLTDLPIGHQMRREDEGPWHVAEAPAGGMQIFANRESSREGSRDSWRRDGGSDRDRNSFGYREREERSNRNESRSREESSSSSSSSNESEEEILKRLMERREKESQ